MAATLDRSTRPPLPARVRRTPTPPTPAASVVDLTRSYVFHDETGTPLYRLGRREFADSATGERRQQSWVQLWDAGRRGFGKRRVSLSGLRRVPYRLKSLLGSGDTKGYVVSSPRRADLVRSRGRPGTCLIGGLSSWRPAAAEYFRGRHAVVMATPDPTEAKFVRRVGDLLTGVAKSVHSLIDPTLNDRQFSRTK